MYNLELVRKDIRLMALNNAGFETGVSNDDLWYEACVFCHEMLSIEHLPDDVVVQIKSLMELASKLCIEGGDLS